MDRHFEKMVRFFSDTALRTLNSVPILYSLIFLTGPLPFVDLITDEWYYAQMMQESGELSIWYLILTLSISPILAIINWMKRGAWIGAWLLRRRKHFGIASFLFAAAHMLHYIRYIGEPGLIWLEAFDLEYFVGWIGVIILVVLAATSNKASVRYLGRSWKTLHYSIYIGAGAIALHWILFEFYVDRVLFWCGVVVAARLVQFWLRRNLAAERLRSKMAGSPKASIAQP